MSKIEEASRKKDEQTNHFISATKEALEQKMGLYEEKREAYITDLRSKLKVNIVIIYNFLLTNMNTGCSVNNVTKQNGRFSVPKYDLINLL